MENEFINKEIFNSSERLVALVCSNLLKEETYYQTAGEKTSNLLKTLNEVYESEPEFILQVAYYARNHMNLRSTPNFLLAYASIRKKTKQILKNYFKVSTRLPGDVIEVADFADVLSNVDFSTGTIKQQHEGQNKPKWKLTLTRELTENVKEKFGDFDEYQLGKHCSEGKRKRQMLKKKRLRQGLSNSQFLEANKKIKDTVYNLQSGVIKINLNSEKKKTEDPQSVNENMDEEHSIPKKPVVLSVKRIDRIKKKQNGKYYPHREINYEEELKKMPKVNIKRLVKICQIQSPKILVHKILGKKYPKSKDEYLQLLNNGNILKFENNSNSNNSQPSDSSSSQKYLNKLAEASREFDPCKSGKRMKLEIPKTWEVEISKKGNNKEAWQELLENKNVPILALLRNLRNIINSNVPMETHKKIIDQLNSENVIINSKVFPFQIYSAYKQIKKINKPEFEAIYSDTLEKALQISTENNCPKLKGKALIFVDVSGSMTSPLSSHSEMTLRECGILLGLMINASCESVEFRAFSSPGKNPEGHIEVPLDSKHILKNFANVESKSTMLGGGTDVPISRLHQALDHKENLDYIIIISDMMIRGEDYSSLSDFLKDYRAQVNPMMKYIAINLNSYGVRLNENESSEESNYDLISGNIFITGYSDKILSMIEDSDVKSQAQKIKVICQKELKLN
jgi:telomerase protein component 1